MGQGFLVEKAEFQSGTAFPILGHCDPIVRSLSQFGRIRPLIQNKKKQKKNGGPGPDPSNTPLVYDI